MQTTEFNQNLLHFLDHSPTPFHATDNLAAILRAAGYQQHNEIDVWNISEPIKAYVIRNGSSLIAFSLNGEPVADSGFRMVGAHTDSPCLKVKPQPEINKNGYLQLGVEVYGGVLLNPWFDRDLSLAGRATFRDGSEKIQSQNIDFRMPIAVIPSLAIHLDREVNKKRCINAQKDLLPVLCQLDNEITLAELVEKQIGKQYSDLGKVKLLDFELSFYDTQNAALIGLNQEFIASARLDNLLSCFTGAMSLINTDASRNCILVCNDHEEVGSTSACGADGPFLHSVLRRLCDQTNNDEENFARTIQKSMLISTDNAHAVHPNFADKHDQNHGPILNKGPVIKVNANQRYATNSETAAVFRSICEQADIPYQSFVSRSDMACGSTIGPITASAVGVQTIDVGVAQFAMHSIRELAGASDAFYLFGALKEFYDARELF